MKRPRWMTWKNAARLPLVLALRAPVMLVLLSFVTLGVVAEHVGEWVDRKLPGLKSDGR